jgi:hypothetical protein
LRIDYLNDKVKKNTKVEICTNYLTSAMWMAEHREYCEMNTLMAKAFFKKTTLFATAFVLAVSTLTAAVPFILSEKASAIAPYNLTAAPYCKDGLVAFDVTGTNPDSGQAPVYVKSSAAFKLSDPVLAQPGATVSVPLFTDLTSVAASAVTIYVSSTENGTYTYLDDPSAVAPYDAFNCTNDVYVATAADNGNDANPGTSVAKPFATIQKAVDTVNANGTVHVAAGTYAGSTNVNKAVTIQGAQAGIDARNRSGEETVLTTSGTASNFNVTASSVVIDGFTLNGPIGDSAALNLMGSFSGTTVKNNIINNSSRAAVFNTSNTTFTKNRINNTAATTISGFEENSNAANNVVIDSNDFYNGNNNADINFIGAAGTQSIGLVVKNNNSFDGTTLLGVTNTINATVTNNTANGNFNSVIFVGGNNKGAQIDGNAIANSNAAGAAVVVINPFGYGVNSDIKGRNNSFAGSVNGVVVYPAGIASGQQADFSGNWWGASNGPTDPTAADGSQPATNSGTGAGAHGVVKYNSWCVNATCSLYSDSTLTAPTDLTPATNTATNNPDFNNTWTVVNGAANYEYQTSYSSNGTTLGTIIYTDSSVTRPSRYSTAGNTVTRTNIDAPDADYYWQVRAINAEGIAGPWSVINKVTVDTDAPDAPVNGQPNNTYVTSNDFYFTWSDEADNGSQVKYEFQSSGNGTTDGNGSLVNAWNSVANGNSEQNNLTTPTIHSTGAPDGQYFWQVRSYDKAGNVSPWSSVWNVTIDSTVSAPTLVSPTNNAFVNGASVTQTWSTNDTDIDYYFYESFNDQAATSSRFSGNYTTTSKTAENIANGTVYYWRVSAIDKAGNTSATSPLWKITIDNDAPTTQGVPSTTTPTQSTTNTWNWSPATDAAAGVKGYEYRVNSGAWVFTANTSVTVSAPTTNGSYSLSVRAIDNANNTGATTTGTAVIDNAGPTEVTVNEASYGTSRPTLTGTVSADAVRVAVAVLDEDGVEVDSGDAQYVSGETTWSYSLTTSLANANYTVIAKAFDGLGNSTESESTEVEVAVVTPAPTTNTQNPSDAGDANGTPLVDPNTSANATPGFPRATGSTGFAGILGEATANADNNAGVEGASTENKDTLAAANTEANKGTFLGLNWYWWILIIAALAAIAWWIAAARKRQAE